jgi:hypothetical protein
MSALQIFPSPPAGSLWELYAFTDLSTARVPLVFLFDTTGIAMKTLPRIFGNFNGWGVGYTMHHWKQNLYRYQISFPAYAELCFRFIVDGTSIITPHIYPVIHDAIGNKLHYIRVAPIPPADGLDATYIKPLLAPSSNIQVYIPPLIPVNNDNLRRVFTLREIISMNQRTQVTFLSSQILARNGPELPVLSTRIVGTYPVGYGYGMIPRMNRKEDMRIANRDWYELCRNIHDILPAYITPTSGGGGGAGGHAAHPGQRVAPIPVRNYSSKISSLKVIFMKYHSLLTETFETYALGCNGYDQSNTYWNLIKFLQFLAIIRVPDTGRTSVARLDKIYYAVLQKREASHSGGASSTSATAAASLHLNAKEIKSVNNSLGKVLLHRENPFSVLNELRRSDFMEAMLRVAMLRYNNPASLSEYATVVPTMTATYDERKDGTVNIPAVGVPKLETVRLAPIPAAESNPAYSLELLMKYHIIPYSTSLSNISLPSVSAGRSGIGNPNELRQRLILDPNVFAIFEQYSEQLHRLFKHYTGGAPASGLGLGIASVSGGGTLANAGIIGGANGANGMALPPTLLGETMAGGLLSTLLPGRTGGAGHFSNGSLRSSASSPIASSTIHLKELELMLSDYELLDPSLSKARAMLQLGIIIDGENDGGGGANLPPSTAGAEFTFESTVELLYPEWLELLVRVADSGHQWSNLYIEQTRMVAAAIASGVLSPIDRPILSAAAGLTLFTHTAHTNIVVEDEQTDDAYVRTPFEETELDERFLRLLNWLFPSELEQRERRAKLAAQQTAQTAPPTQAETKDGEKEGEKTGGKNTAKGKITPGAKVKALVPAAKTKPPVKK